MIKSHIKRKAIKLTFVIGGFSILGVVLIAWGIVGPTYRNIEIDLAREQRNGVETAFNREVEELAKTAEDWGVWEESFHFVKTLDSSYIRENLNVESLQAIDATAFQFVDLNGNVLHTAWGLPNRDRSDLHIPQVDHQQFYAFFEKTESQRALPGYWITTDKKHLWACGFHPIQKTHEDKNINGFLIIYRWINSDRKEKITRVIQDSVEVVLDLMTAPEAPVIRKDSVFTVGALYSLGSEQAATLRIKKEASIWIQGKQTLLLVIVFISGFLILAMVFLLHYLETGVLFPLKKLQLFADHINETDNLNERISIDSEDEIGQLCDSFNRMMSSLELHRSRLNDLALKDDLTGLLNRRAIYRSLHDEIQRSQRYGFQISIVLFDVDFFKDVNDNYSHVTGDKVLQHISRISHKVFRGSDFVGRLGGDEFLAILPHTGLSGASEAAERLRLEIEMNSLLAENGPIATTISLGVATMTIQQTAQDLLQKADEYLYKAKAKGRNQYYTE